MMTTIRLINTSIALQSLFLCACDENAVDLLSVNNEVHNALLLYIILYNRILLNHEEEGSIATCYNMNELEKN